MHDTPEAIGEFDLIRRYFTRPVRQAVLGVGDDCALLAPRAGQQLAISSDMLIEGRHFVSTVPPDRLGHKALAVNLSDLAACGARPLAFTLALALPRVDTSFLDGFSSGLWQLAEAHGCELIGGDTTQGPLAICVTVFGEVPPELALLRSGARAGDRLYVSGRVGDARLALEALRGRLSLPGKSFERVRLAMERPEPRVQLGQALRGIASAAIDVSDGLLGDLQHLLRRSGVGARLRVDEIPRSEDLAAQPLVWQRECTLAGGDDYELLFSVPAAREGRLAELARQAGVALSCIGEVLPESGVLQLLDADGRLLDRQAYSSFDHFKSA